MSKAAGSEIRGEKRYQFTNGMKPRGFGHWYFRDGKTNQPERR